MGDAFGAVVRVVGGVGEWAVCDCWSSAGVGGGDGGLAGGAHQPDSVAAAVIAFETLAEAAGRRWDMAAPVGVGGGLGERLGSRRPLVDMIVAKAAARRDDEQAAAAGLDGETGETDDDSQTETETPLEQPAVVTAMDHYLVRRSHLSPRLGHGSTPFGPGYNPLGGCGSANYRLQNVPLARARPTSPITVET